MSFDWQRADPSGAHVGFRNEVGFFAGETTLNNLIADKSTAVGFEYRHRCGSHVELSTSLFDEGAGAVTGHASVSGEIWATQEFLSGRFAVGLGVGPVAALSAYQTADGRAGASLLGIASMTISWRVTPVLAVRATWHRGFTSDDQDRDIVTMGLGLRF